MGIKWIEANGKKILYSDYRGLDLNEGIENLKQEANTIRQSPTPVLVLDNFAGFPATTEFTQHGKALGIELREKFEKFAQVGVVHGLQRVLVNGFMVVTKIRIRFFDTEAEAITFLTKN